MYQRRYLFALITLLMGLNTASSDDRRIEKEVIVNAPRTEVWQAWTTSEGLKAFVGIESKIQYKLGGAYEWYFSNTAPAGARGSEGCQILAADAPEMLAFSWNAPPKLSSLRSKGARTQVFVRLTEIDPKQTKVSLTHLITETVPEWDHYIVYFENAWPNVLKKMQEYFAKADRTPLPAFESMPRFMNQSFDLDSPPVKVWDAFVKPEIAQQWMTPKYFIELKVGGSMKGTYDLKALPGDDSWIIRDILAYDPGRMLAYQTKKTPAKFPFRKAMEGTYSVVYFDPLPGNKCRLRLVGIALQDDDETKKMHDYFEKANPTVIEKLKGVLAKTP
jgi:uncharacterized protein YndB with AHSA1/START domain